jgi:hypothetical protein
VLWTATKAALDTIRGLLNWRATKKKQLEYAINRVAERYVDSALQFSGIPGALRAGVLQLPDGHAVAEFLKRVSAAGEPCLSERYRSRLRDEELLDFFRLCAAAPTIATEDKVLEIINSIHNRRKT